MGKVGLVPLTAAWLASAAVFAPVVDGTLDIKTVTIPAGSGIVGSDQKERELGYRLDEAAYGHSITRKNGWYDDEPRRQQVVLKEFSIMKTLVTNRLYARFVADTGHRVPFVDAKTWAGYRLVHPYSRARRFNWQNGRPPAGREDHPVVLVSHSDAVAFARWLSDKTGKKWRLPRYNEWEVAARGRAGLYFPWGQRFDPNLLNSHDKGPFDTMPVGSFPAGASPFGVLDMAGQVFEWTSTPRGKTRWYVKGGSWDDKGCGVCRPAAAHTRPAKIKHILIGFRMVQIPDR